MSRCALIPRAGKSRQARGFWRGGRRGFMTMKYAVRFSSVHEKTAPQPFFHPVALYRMIQEVRFVSPRTHAAGEARRKSARLAHPRQRKYWPPIGGDISPVCAEGSADRIWDAKVIAGRAPRKPGQVPGVCSHETSPPFPCRRWRYTSRWLPIRMIGMRGAASRTEAKDLQGVIHRRLTRRYSAPATHSSR